MNKVILCGRICQDLELKYTPQGMAVLNNALAINEKQKNENKTLFIKFAVFGNVAEILQQYAQKGSRILIEGKINLSEYQKNSGEKVIEYKIIALSCEIVDFKQSGTSAQAAPPAQKKQSGGFVKAEDLLPKTQSLISDEDIPF